MSNKLTSGSCGLRSGCCRSVPAVRCRRPGPERGLRSSHRDLERLRAAVVEAQRQRHPFSLSQRLPEADQHDVVAAGAEFGEFGVPGGISRT